RLFGIRTGLSTKRRLSRFRPSRDSLANSTSGHGMRNAAPQRALGQGARRAFSTYSSRRTVMATNATQTPSTTSPKAASFPNTGTGSQPEQTYRDRNEGEPGNSVMDKATRIPADTFLWAALGVVGGSLVLRAARKHNASTFLGQWVSPLLMFGV